MSGGHFNYMYGDIKDTYVGHMEDNIMDRLIEDLCEVLHVLEWYKSGDFSEQHYRDTVEKFKANWIGNVDQVTKQWIFMELTKLADKVATL